MDMYAHVCSDNLAKKNIKWHICCFSVEHCFVVQSRWWTQFYRAIQPTLWTLLGKILGKTQRRIKSDEIFLYKCAVKNEFSFSFIQTKSLEESNTLGYWRSELFLSGICVCLYIFIIYRNKKVLDLMSIFYEIYLNQVLVFYLLQLIITRIAHRPIKNLHLKMGRTISIKCVLLIFLTFVICCKCQSRQIAPAFLLLGRN